MTSRRDFIKIAGGGAVIVVVGSATGWVPGIGLGQSAGATAGAAAGAPAGVTAGVPAALHISDALVEMIDLRPVYMWCFGTGPAQPTFPGPVLTAAAGQSVTLTVTNHLDEPHTFAIDGVTDSGVILPGATATVSFVAPQAGSYIYHDRLNAPVNRVLGLHGAFVVTPVSGNTPYTTPTTQVQQLFDDLPALANPEIAQGESWAPARRTKIWLHHSTDPQWNALAQAGQVVDPAQMLAGFLARYFTINGHSGYFSSHHHDIKMHGRVGQPHLVRLINTGVISHSPHIHGNHIYVVAINGVVQNNVKLVDTFPLNPLDRIDWLVPFIRPPDIPGPRNVPLRVATRQELAFVDSYGLPQNPLVFAMHSHNEADQTAAGGNYPGGAVTHWEISGDVDGVDFPVPQPKLT